MNNTQLSAQRSTSAERQLVLFLVKLAKEKYMITDNFYLNNNLSYFLFNAAEMIPMTTAYSISSIEIMEYLFKSEIDFAKEAVQYIEEHLQHSLRKSDYLVLAESVIAANYQLNINDHEQERYLQLIHYLITQIAFYVNLPRTLLLSGTPRLMRHIKFLALRILKEKHDSIESNNDLYFYVMKNYSKEFYAANQIRVFITENFDFDLSNDEISYLTMHFREFKRRSDEYQLTDQTKCHLE